MYEVESHRVVRLSVDGGVHVDDAAVEAARRAFDRDHCVRLAGLLPAELLDSLPVPLDDAGFESNPHAGLKTELCMDENASLALLLFLVNDPALLGCVGRVTGAEPRGFTGRVYRMVPGMGHHDAWHDDCVDDRVLALSVNVGSAPYAGGTLLMRKQASGEQLFTATNTGLGDALLFRLDPSLQHRVDDVMGDTAKTAFAGWFLAERDLTRIVRDVSAAARA